MKAEIKMKEKTEQITIKAPQEIIHIKHNTTIRQYKYWILLLQELKEKFDSNEPKDEDGFYSVQLSKVSGNIGYLPMKAELKSDLSALRKESICLNVFGKDGEQEYYEAGFISEFKVSTKKIKFKFPSFLEKVMKGVDSQKAIFTLLNWEIFNHFTGKHEAIIYKLCRDYMGAGRTPYMTLKQFREYMGIDEGGYLKFSELNKWCIKKSVDAVNKSEIADLNIEAVLNKNGKNVVGLHFTIKHKKQTSIPFPIQEEDNIFRFAKAPITFKDQKTYLALRSRDEILLCIERGNEYGEALEKTGSTANYGGIYRKAIAEGWHEQQAIKKEKVEKKKAEKQEVKKQEEEETQKGNQKREEGREASKKAFELFEAMADDEKEKIKAEFLAGANTFAKGKFYKDGVECAFFKNFLTLRFKK